jgi:NADPH:quinone reductase-like Zn-dependent oxidoreductase
VRAWRLEESFGLDHLHQVELPRPQPGPGEVLVRIEAVSLNARDRMMIEGVYNPRQPLPLVPCSDGAGVVEQVGASVSRFAVGDRVCPMFAPGWVEGEPTYERIRQVLGGPLDGTLREFLVLPESGVARAPAHLDSVAAATLPCAALTAWSALVTHGGIAEGDTVLTLGTGGVSIFALQIANMMGARVIVTSSSDEKLERARRLGAWETINYLSEPEWGRKARALTERRGVDHVIEVGGAATLEQSMAATRIGGTISSIGVAGSRQGAISVVPIFMGHLRIQGILVGHRRSFEAMVAAIEESELEPVVDQVLPFGQAPEALRELAGGRHFGKICLSFDSAD